MKEMILQFISEYGWKLALIACSGILVLGILKFFNVFNKIEKAKRKYFYAGISSVLSIAASGIYLVFVGQFDMGSFGLLAIAIYGLNQTIYSVYETYGFRYLIKKLGNVVISIVAKRQIEEAKKKADETVADKTVKDVDIVDNMDIVDIEENKEI